MSRSSDKNKHPDKKLDRKEEEFWKWLICEYLEPLDKPTKESGKDDQAKKEKNVRDIKGELRKYR